MRPIIELLKIAFCVASLMVCLLAAPRCARAQASPAIQIFMPDGSLPPSSIRFTLTRDDGRIETFFTDTKGKFQVPGDWLRETDYTITVESDGRTYDRTVATIRVTRSTPMYPPIFLRTFTGKAKPPPGVINVAALDSSVPADARAAYEEAMRAVEQSKTDEAIARFKAAVKLYPRYLRALNDLGVLYLRLNRLDEAAELFNQAIKIDKRFYYARLNLGLVLNRRGDFKAAAELLARLYEENSSLRGLPVTYADALVGAGELSKAEQVLRAVLSEGKPDRPSEVELRFKLSLVLNRENQFDEAVTELQKIIALNPNADNAHLLLGASLLQLKRLAEAEKALLRAYELGGSAVGTAQMFLGQLYLIEQKPEAALAAFERYLKDVPDAPNAALVRAEIDKLKTALKK